jgi:MFS family permease
MQIFKTAATKIPKFLPFSSLDRNLKIIFLSNLLAAFGDGFVVYLLPLYLRDLHATPENIGLLYSLSALTAVITLIPGGFLADRFNQKKIMLFNWLLWIPIPICFFLASDWVQLIIPMLVYGITVSAAASSAYILRYAKQGNLSTAFTTLGAAYSIGYIISPIAASAIVATVSVRASFILTAVFYALAGVAMLGLSSYKPPSKTLADAAQTSETTSPLEPARYGKLVLVAVLFGIMMFTFSMVSTLVPQFLKDVNHFDTASILTFGSVYYIGATFLAFALGKIGDKYGKSYAVVFSMLVLMSGLIVFIGFAGYSFQLVSAFLRGAAFPMWTYIGVMAGSIAPETQKAKWISVVQTATRIAGVPAALVGSILYELGYQTPFIVAIAVAAALAFAVSFKLIKK